jgi:hypothetical protein
VKTSTKRVVVGVVAAAVIAGAAGFLRLRSAHARLAARYDQLLAEFSASAPACPSRPEDGRAAAGYARAFEMLPASRLEYELWNSGQTKALAKAPPGVAPLFEVWAKLAAWQPGAPVTIPADRFVSLEAARVEALAASQLRGCVSPFAPTDSWAREGKPLYGLLALAQLDRVKAYELERGGDAAAAAELRLAAARTLTDLQRDAPLLDAAGAGALLEAAIRDLHAQAATAPAAVRAGMLAGALALDAEWPSFARTIEAELLLVMPTAVLPGVALARAPRGRDPGPISAESLWLWAAAPAFVDYGRALTRAADAASLRASLAERRALAERVQGEYVLPLLAGDLESALPEAQDRKSHALVRLLILRLAYAADPAVLGRLTDPLTGEAFRRVAGGFASAATEPAFRDAVAAKHGINMDGLTAVDVGSR